MVMDGIIPATIVFPLFNFVLRGMRTAYDFASVPDETNDYLQTIKQVLGDLKTAKILRIQNAPSLDVEALTNVDKVIHNTEKAMAGLEALVERARVDMSTNFGSVGAEASVMWVIRDSNKANAAMSRLGIASQSLHGEINMLRSVSSLSHKADKDEDARKRACFQSSGVGGCQSCSPPPPTYQQETVKALRERRSLNERRCSLYRKRSMASAGNLSAAQQASIVLREQVEHEPTTSASVANIAEFIRHNEHMVSSLAPHAILASQESLMPARAVELSNEFAIRENASELEADAPNMPSLRARPTSFSLPQTPTVDLPALQVADAYMSRSLSRQLNDLSLSPAVPPVYPQAETRYMPPSSFPQLLHRSQARLSTQRSAIMESTAMLPGHRTPRDLQWEEPTDNGSDEHADSQSLPSYEAANTGTAEGAPDSFNNTAGEHISPSETEIAPELFRVPTKRRPVRVHNPSNRPPNEPTAPQPDRSASTRSSRNRPSRSDWQVQQQLAG